MRFERIPEIRRSDKPALAHAHHLLGEFFLPARSQNVLNHGVGEDEVETLVGEGKRAPIKLHVLRLGIMPASRHDLPCFVTAGDDAVGKRINILQRILQEDFAAGADVEHANFGARRKDGLQEIEFLGSRLVA